MPLFRGSMAGASAWCELTDFEIVQLPIGAQRTFPRAAQQERLLIVAGACRVARGGEESDATAGAKYGLAEPGTEFAITAVREPTTLVRLCGTWGPETGGWGLFRVEEIADPVERGDPTDYPKRTRIDNHYHDCERLWTGNGAGAGASSGISAVIS